MFSPLYYTLSPSVNLCLPLSLHCWPAESALLAVWGNKLAVSFMVMRHSAVRYVYGPIETVCVCPKWCAVLMWPSGLKSSGARVKWLFMTPRVVWCVQRKKKWALLEEVNRAKIQCSHTRASLYLHCSIREHFSQLRNNVWKKTVQCLLDRIYARNGKRV